MADTGVDIDLYGDMESEFPAEDGNPNESSLLVKSEGQNDAELGGSGIGEDANAGGSDLFDDVLTLKDVDKTGVKSESRETSVISTSNPLSSSSVQGRRYQLYVGNLTWWTTDADIADVVLSLGVNDFIEVKFYENRANGQSKGFCCVSLGSESSSRTVIISHILVYYIYYYYSIIIINAYLSWRPSCYFDRQFSYLYSLLQAI